MAEDLEKLAARYGLDGNQRAQLASLLQSLAQDHAPTAVREHERALAVHVADPLVALELESLRGARAIADVGSGAGLPGAVLAVALPGARVSLVESERRKCEFAATMVSRARVTNAHAVWARAEEWSDGLGAQDVVTARALAPAPVVLEYAAPLLRPGGVLVDWRGRRDAQEEQTAAAAATQLGLELVEIRRVKPYEAAREHHLHVYAKVGETPPRFPRRAGVARKRPLG